jgi:hypothetical protein
MEQRAREMGKTSEAAVYRKYINSMKKKTKKMNEGMYNHSEFALITVAVDELEKGLMELEGITYDSVDKLMQGIAKRNIISPTLLHNQFKSKHLAIPDDWAIKQRMNRARGIGEEKMTEKEMDKREDIVKGMKKNKSGFKKRYGDDAKSVMYATATKLAMKKEEYISELSDDTMNRYKKKASEKITNHIIGIDTAQRLQQKRKVVELPKRKQSPIAPVIKAWVQSKITKASDYLDTAADYLDSKEVNEEGLRAWFGKSSGTTKSGRKVKGWVQVGGKYDGKPCARQPGQKTTPKCTSSSKRSSMSDKERDSAARRKRAADPGQPQKSGAAAPTMVSTDPKKKMKEEYKILPLNLEIPKSALDFKQGLMFRESLDTDSGMLFVFDNIAKQSFHMTETIIPSSLI